MEYFNNLMCLINDHPKTALAFGLGSILIPYLFSYLEYRSKNSVAEDQIEDFEEALERCNKK